MKDLITHAENSLVNEKIKQMELSKFFDTNNTNNIPYIEMHNYLTTDYDSSNHNDFHYDLEQIESNNNPPYKMDDFSSNLIVGGVTNDFKYFNNFTKMKQGKFNKNNFNLYQ